MLTLFSELNDAEVAILIECSRSNGKGRHPYSVLDGDKTAPAENLPTTERSFRLSVYDSYADRLITLGLLKAGNLGQLLEHRYGDERLLVSRPMFYSIAPLGWLMLQHVGGTDRIEGEEAGAMPTA